MCFSSLSSARIWSFICGSFVWQCLHSSDGWVLSFPILLSPNLPDLSWSCSTSAWPFSRSPCSHQIPRSLINLKFFKFLIDIRPHLLTDLNPKQTLPYISLILSIPFFPQLEPNESNCFLGSAKPNSGWSDGSGKACQVFEKTPFTSERCLRNRVQPAYCLHFYTGSSREKLVQFDLYLPRNRQLSDSRMGVPGDVRANDTVVSQTYLEILGYKLDTTQGLVEESSGTVPMAGLSLSLNFSNGPSF